MLHHISFILSFHFFHPKYVFFANFNFLLSVHEIIYGYEFLASAVHKELFSCASRPLLNKPNEIESSTSTISTTTQRTVGFSNQNLRDVWTQQTRPGWSTPSSVPRPNSNNKWPSANFGEDPTPVQKPNPGDLSTIGNSQVPSNAGTGTVGHTVTNTNINTNINEVTEHRSHPFISKPIMQGSTSNSLLEVGDLVTGKPLPSLTATIDASATINTNVNTDTSSPVLPDDQVIHSNTNTISSSSAVIVPGSASSTFSANSNTFISRTPATRRNGNRRVSNRNRFSSQDDTRRPITRNRNSEFPSGSNVGAAPNFQFHRVRGDDRNELRDRNRPQHIIITSNEQRSDRRRVFPNDREPSDRQNPLFVSPTQRRPENNRFGSVVFHRITDAPHTTPRSTVRVSTSNIQIDGPDNTRRVSTNVRTSTTNTRNNNRQYWVTPDRYHQDDKYSWITSSDVAPSGPNRHSPLASISSLTSDDRHIDSSHRGSSSTVDDKIDDFNPSDFYASFFNSGNRPSGGTTTNNVLASQNSNFQSNNRNVNIDRNANIGENDPRINFVNRNNNRGETHAGLPNTNFRLGGSQVGASNFGSGGNYASNEHNIQFKRIRPTKPSSNNCNDRNHNQHNHEIATTTLRPTFLPVDINFPDITYVIPGRNKTSPTRPSKPTRPVRPIRPSRPFKPNRPVRPSRPLSFLSTTTPSSVDSFDNRPVRPNRFRPFQSTPRPNPDYLLPASNIISSNNIGTHDSFSPISTFGFQNNSFVGDINSFQQRPGAGTGGDGFNDFFNNHINSHFGSGSFGNKVGSDENIHLTGSRPNLFGSSASGFGSTGISSFGNNVGSVGVDSGGSFGIKPVTGSGGGGSFESIHRPIRPSSSGNTVLGGNGFGGFGGTSLIGGNNIQGSFFRAG